MRALCGTLLVVCLACTDAAPDVVPTSPRASERPSPTESSKVEPSKVEPDSIVTTTPDQPAIKAEPPSAPLVRDSGVPKPPWTEILALARAAGLSAPASVAPPEELGPRRWVALVRTRDGADPARFALHLLVLELPAPIDERDMPAWTLATRVQLEHWTRPWRDDDEHAGDIPTSIYVDDYDDDGELELLVRYRNEIMCPGVGEQDITNLMIVEASEQPPRVGLHTEIDRPIGSGWGKVEAKIEHVDLNADGHRDMRIRYRTSIQDMDDETKWTHEDAENHWRWDAEQDAWTRARTGGELPEYDRWGCKA